jgi:hypothetical protein
VGRAFRISQPSHRPTCFALLGRPRRPRAAVGLSRDFKEDLHIYPPALRASKAATELIERHSLAAGPYQRFHVEFGGSVTVDARVVPALRPGAGHDASDADAPAEPPGFAEGIDGHENKMRTCQVLVKRASEMEEKPKYDVAISFLAKDEAVGSEINSKLEQGLRVFFFPRRQEELASTDGLESMRTPFLEALVT